MPAIVPANTLLDVAVLKIGGTAIGVTRGGIRRSNGTEWRAVEFDGRRSAHVVGLDRKTSFGDRIETRILEFSAGNLDKLRNISGGAPAVAKAGELYTSARYLSNVAMVYTTGDGGAVEVVYPKALLMWTELTGEDKSEGEAAIALEPAIDPTLLTTDDAPYTVVHRTAAAVGGPTNVLDNFSRTSAVTMGTADSGHVWTADKLTMGTDGSAAYHPSGPDYGGAAWVESDRANGAIKATISVIPAGGGDPLGVYFRRGSSFDDHIRSIITSTALFIRKQVAGTETEIFSGGVGGIVNGMVMEVIPNGTAIDVEFDNVLKASIVEAAHASNTKHGIYIEEPGGVGRITKFEVTA